VIVALIAVRVMQMAVMQTAIRVTSEWQLDKTSQFSIFRAEPAVEVVAVLALDFTEAVPVARQARIRFGAAFGGSRFATAGAKGHPIGGSR
jgi:hypothetical protein